MIANELRIGNLIETPRGVKSISEIGFKETNENSKDYYCRFDNLHEGYYLSHCEPIPLTEEWLVKFGFKKDNNGSFWIDLTSHYLELVPSGCFFYPVFAQIPEISNEIEQRVSLNRIEYVHQLQNLFYALVGEELTIKEKENG